MKQSIQAFLVLTGCILLVGVQMASAGLVTMEESNLEDLLGANPAAIGNVTVTAMISGSLHTTVYSQAYTNDQGDYAYLYQLENNESGASPIEMFTLDAFRGANDSTPIGYLSGDVPEGFIAGGLFPEDQGYILDELVSIYFTLRAEAEIPVGENSVVMYAVTDYLPGVITANVINGNVASGPVVGPVPEPATICLISLGGLTLLRRRKE